MVNPVADDSSNVSGTNNVTTGGTSSTSTSSSSSSSSTSDKKNAGFRLGAGSAALALPALVALVAAF